MRYERVGRRTLIERLFRLPSAARLRCTTCGYARMTIDLLPVKAKAGLVEIVEHSDFSWEKLGTALDGRPVHLPVPLDALGNRCTVLEADQWQCWCDVEDCGLSLALADAVYTGEMRAMRERGGR